MLLRSGIRLLWPALQIPNAGLFRSVETVAHFVRGSRINRRARDRRAGVDLFHCLLQNDAISARVGAARAPDAEGARGGPRLRAIAARRPIG